VARSRSFTFRAGGLGYLVAFAVFYHYAIRPRILSVGVEGDEATCPLPGDAFVTIPSYQTTRALTVHAPPAAVWGWLAQLGRKGTGFYGLDALTNNGQPSAAYLRHDLPPLSIGMSMDGGYEVLDVSPAEWLVYGSFGLSTPIGQPMSQTVSFNLTPHPEGTRLIRRVRGYVLGRLGKPYSRLLEVIDHFEGTVQMDNLRTRAEVMASLVKAPTSP